MRDARFSIPESLIAKAVDLIDSVPMDDRDTKGDVYEYMLGKLATSGTNGQFRTPRHIIRFMVEVMAPTPKEVMVDPAAGTCGFLMVTLLVIENFIAASHRMPSERAICELMEDFVLRCVASDPLEVA